jgi:hypothetical protein
MDLGIGVPAHDEFVVSKKIPTKTLGRGEPTFQLICNSRTPIGETYLLEPQRPIQRLEMLSTCKLSLYGNDVFLVYRSNTSDADDRS